MPCGGIYWIKDLPDVDYSSRWCFYCKVRGDIGPWSYVEEWDADIHDKCIDEFLKTAEGEIITGHGHEIVRRPRGHV